MTRTPLLRSKGQRSTYIVADVLNSPLAGTGALDTNLMNTHVLTYLLGLCGIQVKMSSLIQTLRAACLQRGASGIHGIGRCVFNHIVKSGLVK